MTFEDGQHYVAEKFTESDLNAIDNGILTVIRCSDAKELYGDGTFRDLPKWEN